MTIPLPVSPPNRHERVRPAGWSLPGQPGTYTRATSRHQSRIASGHCSAALPCLWVRGQLAGGFGSRPL